MCGKIRKNDLSVVYSKVMDPSRERKIAMNAVDRFLTYVRYDTQSDEHSDTTPTTEKQKVLGAALAE